MRRLLAPLALSLSLQGCINPPSSGERLIQEANQVVTAARFGRMDIVLASVRPDLRSGFAAAHAEWGGRIRILDMEYGGITPTGEKEALVVVTVAWTRLNETTVRTTTLKQTWEFGEEKWQMVDEDIVDGDGALLTKPTPAPGLGDLASTYGG